MNDSKPSGNWPRLAMVMRACLLSIFVMPVVATADSVVVFNELQYHPADDSSEWLELRNQLAVDIDLSGWSLAGGIGYSFAEGTIIPAGACLLVAERPAEVSGALGPWTGKLDNAGETIELRNNSERVMDKIAFGVDGDWPVAADGFGFTLAKRNANLDTGDPLNWLASRQPGGTPGTDNFPTTLPPITTLRVETGTTWQYLVDGSDPGSTWKEGSYDDSSWQVGPGTFQLDQDSLPEPAAVGTTLSSVPVTSYFRTRFQFPGDPATTGLQLRLLVDDGAAVYLNGGELVRLNLAPNAGSINTALIPHRAAPRFQDFEVPAGALIQGENVLAVELHQAAALPAYPAAIVAAGPVAYWRLGEAAGPVADLAELPGAPESGPQNGTFMGLLTSNLGVAGPRQSDTISGNALTGFEAANAAPKFQSTGVALFPDDGNLDFSAGKKFSFEVWVKGDPTQEGSAAVIAKGTGGGGEQFACDMVNNSYRFFAWDGGSPNTAFAAQSSVKPNNAWQHLAGVCDIPNGIFRLYVNGVQKATTTPRPTLIVTNHDVSVGARKGSSGPNYDKNFNGIVDEVALFNRALSVGEITAHYNAAFAASASGVDTSDAVFAMELRTIETPTLAPPAPLVLNEIGGAGASFGVELINRGGAPLNFGGGTLSRLDSAGVRQDFPIGAQTIAAGGFLSFDAAALGWSVASDDRILLTTSDGTPLDGRVVKNTPRARQPNGIGEWMRPSSLTLGAANDIGLHHEIVINEIMYHPPGTASEWVELWNRSAGPVDLSGWKLAGGVAFTFPPGTELAAGGFLVVAGNPANVTGVSALGPWSGSLANDSDMMELTDATGNPADRVHYYDGGHWPEFPDGGGSSLELRDPRADHNAAENWAASDESANAQWQTFTWRGPANLGIAGEPTLWNEINMGLLDGPGELLIDDVSVIDTTTSQQLVQNGSFSAGMSHWRATGTHRLTQVAGEPGNSGNQVLHVISTGPCEYQGNQIESTFINNTQLVAGRDYEISLRARWLAGGALLNTRLYFNRLARTHQLAVPSHGGTPGRANSRALANIGPTYAKLNHAPVIPNPGQPVTVSVDAADPDGLATMTLKYAIAGGAWQSTPMISEDGRHFQGVIPGQLASNIVQFYVEGADVLATTSACPAGGAASRALYVVEDGQAAGGSPHKFRLVMTAADASFMHADINALSNATVGATIISDESEIYYDAAVRLKGSFVGRNVPRVGFNVRFQPDRLFRGVHDKVAIDRSAGAVLGQSEILAKHIASHAGGIPNMYDDIGKFIHVLPSYTSGCIVRLTGYEDEYLSTQFPKGDDGRMYEYEVMRSNNVTSDGTPEGIKMPGSGFAAKPDLKDLGDDKEAYRWVWLISNHRAEDDYASPMAVGKMFSMAGTAFDNESKARLDVNQWLRTLAYQTLIGPSDTIYTANNSNPHNIRFFTRPSDGTMLYMPWDWDGCFSQSSSAGLNGTGNVAKLVTVTANNQRVYLNQIYDIIDSTFNTSYMSRWTQHYASVTGESYSGILSYIGARSAYALAHLPTATTFAATAGVVGADGSVTLTGEANIAVAAIEINGVPYTPVWISNTSWQIVVPLAGGSNELHIRGLDLRAKPVAGTDATLTVENPHSSGWPVITINEWMASNTTIPDPADGKKDDWFELHNPTATAVDLCTGR